jgi:hypothetical protein
MIRLHAIILALNFNSPTLPSDVLITEMNNTPLLYSQLCLLKYLILIVTVWQPWVCGSGCRGEPRSEVPADLTSAGFFLVGEFSLEAECDRSRTEKNEGRRYLDWHKSAGKYRYLVQV